MGGAPVCAVALNQTDSSTIDLEKQARVQAPGCAVYSNSKAANGLDARDNATLASAFTCSAGGYRGSSASFTRRQMSIVQYFPILWPRDRHPQSAVAIQRVRILLSPLATLF